MAADALTVVCWKWTPPADYHSSFNADTVNVLRHMVDRYYPDPHRFVCVTDNPEGIELGVEVVTHWRDFADVPSPHHGRGKPSCYRRLRMFAPDAGEVLGPRFVSLDLDCVIVGDLRKVWNRDEDFIIWGDTNRRTLYNGSMMLLSAGARPKVWSTFDPKTSPAVAKAAGNFGSDQAWISYCLGPGEAKWGQKHGIYSFRNDLMRFGAAGRLPANTRIVFFHGPDDPWDPPMQEQFPWIGEHYR